MCVCVDVCVSCANRCVHACMYREEKKTGAGHCGAVKGKEGRQSK